MALKIAVLKNFLKTCPSPFVVRSDSSDVVEYERFVEIMAAGRTALSQIEILGAMQLYKEELQKQLAEGKTVKTPTGSFYMSAAGSMESIDESYLPNDQTNNHAVRLHHKPDSAFENSILLGLKIVREERPNLAIPSLRAVLAAGEVAGAHPLGRHGPDQGPQAPLRPEGRRPGGLLRRRGGSRGPLALLSHDPARDGPGGRARHPGPGHLRGGVSRRGERQGRHCGPLRGGDGLGLR